MVQAATAGTHTVPKGNKMNPLSKRKTPTHLGTFAAPVHLAQHTVGCNIVLYCTNGANLRVYDLSTPQNMQYFYGYTELEYSK